MDEGPRDGYMVRGSRPRIEGLFARIERWTRADGDVHWESIEKEQYSDCLWQGQRVARTICNPSDPSGKTRVFSWLIVKH